MVQKFNQAGIACVCSDSMNTAIRQSLDIPEGTMINTPDDWFAANKECTKVAPGWGAKANYVNYDPKLHYDSLVKLKQTTANIVEQVAGKEAVEIYWSEVERRQKKIWRDYE